MTQKPPKPPAKQDAGNATAAAGFFLDYLQKAQAVVSSPDEFFADMPQTDDLKYPIAIFLVSDLICSILMQVTGQVFFNAIVQFILSIGMVFLSAYAAHKLGEFLDGNGTFDECFKVCAFSSCTLMIRWLPMQPWITMIWLALTAWLYFVGFKRIHNLDDMRGAAVALIAAMLSTIIVPA